MAKSWEKMGISWEIDKIMGTIGEHHGKFIGRYGTIMGRSWKKYGKIHYKCSSEHHLFLASLVISHGADF
jgi:hypothetical protein